MTEPGSTDGRTVLAEGREAVIFEWGDGLVLRLARSPEWAASVALSSVACEAARRAGVRTPRLIETLEVDGCPGQVFERVAGHDHFTMLAANPLRLLRVARRLAAVHVELHQVEAPNELPPTREVLGRRIERSDLVPADVKRRALADLERLPDGDRICHGDFHPGNLLDAPDGPTLIDWTGATSGDPRADVARTQLMLQVGDVPPGVPWVVAKFAAIGRGALWRTYARAYRRLSPVDEELFRRWTYVAAANRLSEGVPGERPALLLRT